MVRARAALSNAVDVASTLQRGGWSLMFRLSVLEKQARARDAQPVLWDRDLATIAELYGT